MIIEPSATITDTFHQGTTGLSENDFTVSFFKNGVVVDINYTIEEISGGFYSITFTIDSTDNALWSLSVYRSPVRNVGTYRAKKALQANVIQNQGQTSTTQESLSYIRIAVDAIREMVSAIYRRTSL